MSERRRLLLVKLDAVDGELAQRWISEGHLPTLGALAERGALLPLRSDAEMLPEATSVSTITGVGPGRNGHYNWRIVRPGTTSLRLATHDSWSKPFWRVLRERAPASAPRVVLVDVPFARPSGDDGITEINGWGLRVERHGSSWPPELFDQLARRHAPWPAWINRDYRRSLLSERRYRRTLVSLAGRRTRLIREMLERYEWDFAFIAYMEGHNAGHAFFHHLRPDAWCHDPKRAGRMDEALLDVYRGLDSGLGELVDAVGEDTDVIAFSGMGLQPNYGSDQLLGRVLIALGYEVRAKPSQSARSRELARWMATTIVPRSVRHRVRGLLPAATVQELNDRSWHESIDWSRSRAVSEPQPGSGLLRVNLAGREPGGIVEPAEREALVDEIAAELSRLESEESAPAVGRVVRIEEIAPGPHAKQLPDLIVEWAPGTSLRHLRHPRVGLIEDAPGFFPPTEHNGSGFLVAGGPSFRQAGEGPVPRDLDIAPTVLHMMGCPVPEQFEGVVLERLLSGGPPVVRKPIDLAIDPFANDPARTE